MFPKYNKMSSLSASRRFGHLLLSPASQNRADSASFTSGVEYASTNFPSCLPPIQLLEGADGSAGHLQWDPWAPPAMALGSEHVGSGSRQHNTPAWSIIRLQAGFGLMHKEPQEHVSQGQPYCSLETRAPGKAELLWGNKAFSTQCCS